MKMNIIIDISQIEYMNFVFLEKKKNIIVDGYFTKIIYSDPFVTFNNIYINCPIQIQYISNDSSVKNSVFFNTSHNIGVIKMITKLEEQIIESYKKRDFSNSSLFYRNIDSVHQVENNFHTKTSEQASSSGDSQLLQTLSSHSSSPEINRITEPRRGAVVLQNVTPNGSTFLQPLINENNTNDSSITSNRHYKKNNNLSLYNQLKSGKIKLFREYNMEEVDQKIIELNNIHIVLKISGIWETNNDIGIAFKFLEMYG